jgi:hypothetical protein
MNYQNMEVQLLLFSLFFLSYAILLNLVNDVVGYKLGCSQNRFQGLWTSCYVQTHSRSACFGRLYKQHIIKRTTTGKIDKKMKY